MAVTPDEVRAVEEEIALRVKEFDPTAAEALRATARDRALDAAARADAQLNLAGQLAFAGDDADIAEAVKLLDAINTRHMPEDDHAECLFLRAVGLMRLGRHSECREALRELTDRHPAFMRGVALRDVFAAHVAVQGRAGLAIVIGGAIALGLAAWWFWPRGGVTSDAPAADAAAGRRYTGGYSHRPSSGLRGGGYSFGSPLRR
ncbi:hypothetical protein FNF27_00097 [Cafeteria roenbergensis]|uniref:Tetratricopeptide repeat protein n=1 Tax=Cafeteria roenbergensis TaxID=33653 RepID=A0A5A8CIN4_CAFRO|nr:hypothetical protein FNF29_03449 [Cafeteria roenbergensis]KAA0178243.1 hypothetical protein FNF27_00097 [Cafeteria roenbergensis]|mmetsp:Transcript_12741/g.48854  ORF Transcript_12741/g.48854 Transcript_12741/m.48854 type:complete len:204 (+) Transcript_12741:95-706(+)|eukprot:KAA0152925.1 hypothetical protein FNF29_03449 [Cafeteria roenbergensis]